MKMNCVYVVILGFVAGCSSGPKVDGVAGRFVLDNSNRGDDLPDWTKSTRVGWEDNGMYYVRAEHTVKGNQRVNACYDLAKLDLKEGLLSEISSSIKGEINLASEGTAEELDPMLTKSLMTEIKGNIKGLRVQEQAFERYIVNDVERVDCFVLASMKASDYRQLRSTALQQALSASAEAAKAMRDRQVRFFNEGAPAQTEQKQEVIQPDQTSRGPSQAPQESYHTNLPTVDVGVEVGREAAQKFFQEQ